MDKLKAVYTEKTQCQDCYKCVRHCPVKAIKVENGSAIVEPDKCIYCGNCVLVCPVGAKKIRDDLDRAKQLLKRKQKVIVSLAPSYVSEFSQTSPYKIISALKKLGFWGVSETALGAQIVSKVCADKLKTEDGPLFISSACPVICDFIVKYYPELTNAITNVSSPVIAHAKYLKKVYGDDIGIVFISPCIAKKNEIEEYDGLIDVALTFPEIQQWLAQAGINPKYIVGDESNDFIPEKASDGALYPMDGGMLKTIQNQGGFDDVLFMSMSGRQHILNTLDGLQQMPKNKKVFLEILACPGGCINGPTSLHNSQTVLKRLSIFDYTKNEKAEKIDEINIEHEFKANPVNITEPSISEITSALKRIGKTSRHDELNCGGCGYSTCRDFIVALLNNRAETSMCVSYMRKLAMNKANALIQAMPSGVVIVDENLMVIESNKKFAELIGGDLPYIYEANPGLKGAYLQRILPFAKHFEALINSKADLIEKEIYYQEKIIKLLVFVIEKHRIVGGIMQDITQPTVQRDQIIKKAKQVIKTNLTTVQQIAFLLGENAAESEVLLNSIIESFSHESE